MARETYNYCDCKNHKNEMNIRLANDGRFKMSPTKINKDGTCVYCGYVAVVCGKPLAIVHANVRYRGAITEKYITKYLRD